MENHLTNNNSVNLINKGFILEDVRVFERYLPISQIKSMMLLLDNNLNKNNFQECLERLLNHLKSFVKKETPIFYRANNIKIEVLEVVGDNANCIIYENGIRRIEKKILLSELRENTFLDFE